MEKITLYIKDKSKLHLLLEWLKQFDFVEVQKPKVESKSKSESKKSTYNFFDSAGMWENRDITAESLREKAWSKKR